MLARSPEGQRKRRFRKKVLDTLTAYWAEHGYGPSQREVAELCGIQRSTVSRWYDDLDAAGLIDRGPFGLYRATKPVVKPQDTCPVCGRGGEHD